MKLLFLHGAPAVGKLTVAKALLRLVPGRQFDNHAAIDIARTVFDFAAPGFWELIHTVRCAVLDAAARQHVPLVVVTYCYADPEDRAAFAEFEAIMERHGGEIFPVFLRCSREETLRRVGNPARAQRGKVTSEQSLNEFLAQLNIAPVPHPGCLVLDTERRSAQANALEIVRHFELAALRSEPAE